MITEDGAQLLKASDADWSEGQPAGGESIASTRLERWLELCEAANPRVMVRRSLF